MHLNATATRRGSLFRAQTGPAAEASATVKRRIALEPPSPRWRGTRTRAQARGPAVAPRPAGLPFARGSPARRWSCSSAPLAPRRHGGAKLAVLAARVRPVADGSVGDEAAHSNRASIAALFFTEAAFSRSLGRLWGGIRHFCRKRQIRKELACSAKRNQCDGLRSAVSNIALEQESAIRQVRSI